MERGLRALASSETLTTSNYRSVVFITRNFQENLRKYERYKILESSHLFKRCIREPISGNVELYQILVKLLEENFKLFHRVFFAVLCREDEDNI